MSRQTKALHNHKALNVQNIKWEETWHYSRFKPLKNCQYFIWNEAIQCHTSNRSTLNDWNTTNTQVKCTFQNRMLNNYHLDVSWKHWNYDHGQRRWVIRDFFSFERWQNIQNTEMQNEITFEIECIESNKSCSTFGSQQSI